MKVLEWIEKKEQISEQDFNDAMSAGEIGREMIWQDVNESLWAVLKDKTQGETQERVDGVKEGNGTEAYKRMYKWFTMTSDLGLAERRTSIMRPNAPKKEENVAGALERWERDYRDLASMDTNSQMSNQLSEYKI